jgi:hypothetical protein
LLTLWARPSVKFAKASSLAQVLLALAHSLFRQFAAGNIPQHHLNRGEPLISDCQCHDLNINRMTIQSQGFNFLKLLVLSAIGSIDPLLDELPEVPMGQIKNIQAKHFLGGARLRRDGLQPH